MLYQISRNGQMYGPYTLEDLKRYLASGNVLASDLAKSEAMPDWLPVSQVLGITPPPAAAPAYGAGSVPYAAPHPAMAVNLYEDPPGLSMGLLILFSFLTCGIFSLVYNFIQATWMRRVQRDSKALSFYSIMVGLMVLNSLLNFSLVNFAGNAGPLTYGRHMNPSHGLAMLAGLGSTIMLFVARFSLRDSLQKHFNTAEPIGLHLSPVMTFLFGEFYFQYHFNRINLIKQAARISAFR